MKDFNWDLVMSRNLCLCLLITWLSVFVWVLRLYFVGRLNQLESAYF
uniref:Uncharacterized protein n=1 Tax=Rhizophora mucronata TaxID=61149 RepID=A0A2P2NP08_RHIMU